MKIELKDEAKKVIDGLDGEKQQKLCDEILRSANPDMVAAMISGCEMIIEKTENGLELTSKNNVSVLKMPNGKPISAIE